MKKRIYLFVFSFVFYCTTTAQFPNATLFNTASNAAGNGTLTLGSNDLNWTAAFSSSLGPYVPAVVCGLPQVPNSWVISPYSNCNWICYPFGCGILAVQNCSQTPPGIDVYYKLTFCLPANVCGQSVTTPSAYCLSLDFYSDNCVYAIYVNNVLNYQTSVSNPYNYSGQISGNATSVSLCNNWQIGSNTIIVHTKSNYDPTPNSSYEGFLAQVNQTINPITQPVNANVVVTNSCGAASSATVFASGGVAPYTYTWLPAGGNGSVAANLSAGTYTLLAQGANSCVATNTFIIPAQAPCPCSNSGSLTVNSGSVIVNHYSPLSANLSAGSNTLQLAAPSLVNLTQGDLIMVYQAQGASINTANTVNYGNITNYNSAGLFEFKYVQSVSGNIVTTQGTFTNSYQLAGKPQVIKVPQYSTLTVNAGASIVAKKWKDTTISNVAYRFGGLVVIHATSIINNGTITASGCGFRGGAQPSNSSANYNITTYVSNSIADGAEKGESVFGFQPEYTANGGRYGRGAPANGGGGGDAHNAAGGGGANGFNGNTWTGCGVMIVNAANPIAAWMLDPDYIANSNALTNSSGGGRGGYSFSAINANALTQGPGNSAWGVDYRRNVGGLGGRPLTNIDAESRVYFGGGGGAGHANNGFSTPGGNGGGIVYLVTVSGISGSGLIASDGNAAGDTFGSSVDAPSGGGAGGNIIIKTTGIANTLTITVKGGNGGNQMQILPLSGSTYASTPNESEGPGGGGGGGFVAISSSAIVPLVNGGDNGISLSPAVTEFPANGATAGASGQIGTVSSSFISSVPIPSQSLSISGNFTICSGETTTLSAVGGTSYTWFPNGITGNTYTNTPNSTSLYTVVGTTSAGCITSLTALVYVSQTSFTLGPTFSITCANPTIQINTGNSALTYTWFSASTFPITGTVNSFNQSNVGIWTVTAVNPTSGCTQTHTMSIVQNTTIPVVASLTPTLQNITCINNSIQSITATAQSPTQNVTHSFISASVGNTINIISNPAVFGAGLDAYTYVLTDNANGCSASPLTFSVLSAPGIPTFQVMSTGTLAGNGGFTVGCNNHSLTVLNIVNANTTPVAGGALTFSFYTPNGSLYAQSQSAVVSQPGIWMVRVMSLNNNCKLDMPVTVIQNTVAPSAEINIPISILTCATPTTVLTGVTSNSNAAFSWINSSGAAIPLQSISINTLLPSNKTYAGNYTLSVTDLNNGCTNTTSVSIQQNLFVPIPNISLTNNTITCITPSIQLSNSSTTGISGETGFMNILPVVVILWQAPPPLPNTEMQSSYMASQIGTYTMTVRDENNGCISQTVVTIDDGRVYPIITPTEAILDCGETAATVSVQVSPESSFYSYVWENDGKLIAGTNSTSVLKAMELGTYTVLVNNKVNGCTNSGTVQVVKGTLTGNFNADKIVGCAPMKVEFKNASTSSLNNQSITSVWSFGNGTSQTQNNISETVFTEYTQAGTYRVVLFTSKGDCSDEDTLIINVDVPVKLEVPNVFTPNNDGVNDNFFLHAANLSEINISIFDRWGNKVYELTSYTGNIIWNGKNTQGKDVADGTYFYIIKAASLNCDNEHFEKRGIVTLLR